MCTQGTIIINLLQLAAVGCFPSNTVQYRHGGRDLPDHPVHTDRVNKVLWSPCLLVVGGWHMGKAIKVVKL